MEFLRKFLKYILQGESKHVSKIVSKILHAEEAQQTVMAKQAFDLALLAQGLLKGADLTAFVERSVEVI